MAQVLIVEDEAPLRRIVARNLERHGHRVVEAKSVAEAEQALQAQGQRSDLILLDVCLPDAAGWDVLRELHESCATRPRSSS